MGDRGGSWGEDGTIVFAPDNRVALSKVSSVGGTPQPLNALDKQAGETTQRWPGKWQVSTGGGVSPRWSRNGKELFYRTVDSKIMVAAYTNTADSFHADKPQLWSPGQFTEAAGSSAYMLNFDLHPDGKRFAVLKAGGTREAPKVDKVSFIFNFFDELRRRVPAGKN